MLRITHPVLAALAETILTEEERHLFMVNSASGYHLSFVLPETHANFHLLELRVKHLEHALKRLKALQALGAAAQAMGLFDQEQPFLEEV
jgi:hypothetical protein